jgi:hypothetical protein
MFKVLIPAKMYLFKKGLALLYEDGVILCINTVYRLICLKVFLVTENEVYA